MMTANECVQVMQMLFEFYEPDEAVTWSGGLDYKLVAIAAIVLLCASSAAEARNYCRSTVTGRFITRNAASLDRPHSKCIPALTAPWLVIQWQGDTWCQVWHNDAPPVGVYNTVAVGDSNLEAWVKAQALYSKGVCR